MTEIEERVFIPIPRASVFQFASRPENMPLWNPAVLESRAIGTLRAGTRVVQLVRLLGRSFETIYEVTEYEPVHRITFTSTSGPLDVRGAMEFRATRGGTLVDWTVRGDDRGVLRAADRVVLAMGHREMHRCLENLKRACERAGTG